MARPRKSGRNVNGILLLNKPLKIGSNEALQIVKALFKAKKAGHTGSLDRLASGLLPICFGEATKLSGFLLNANKRYESTLRLGVVTSTGDAEGNVLRTTCPPNLAAMDYKRVLKCFEGDISQIPPMHSAIKIKGQRLYKLAHQGIVVAREPRTVTIHELHYVGHQEDRLSVEVFCSKGTYIRTLAEDIGEHIGCGASLCALHRTASGPFSASAMFSLDELRVKERQGTLDEAILPMDSIVMHLPEVSLSSDVAFYLKQGQPVLVPHAPTQGLVRIYLKRERFLGVGEVLDDGRIAPRRLIKAVA